MMLTLHGLVVCDQSHKGPFLGVWLADHDAPTPNDASSPLHDSYALVGTVKSFAVKSDPDLPTPPLGERLRYDRAPELVEMVWIARCYDWFLVINDRKWHRMVVQPGTERWGWHPPMLSSTVRLVVPKIGAFRHDGLTSRATPQSDGMRTMTFYYAPEPQP